MPQHKTQVSEKTIVAEDKDVLRLIKIIRSSRLGRVHRKGRKGSRTYIISPRNPQEMPSYSRRLLDMSVILYNNRLDILQDRQTTGENQ